MQISAVKTGKDFTINNFFIIKMSDTHSPMQSEMSRRDITLFSFQFIVPLGIAIILTVLYFTGVSKNTTTLVGMIVALEILLLIQIVKSS